jgi:hypothetical protein
MDAGSFNEAKIRRADRPFAEAFALPLYSLFNFHRKDYRPDRRYIAANERFMEGYRKLYGAASILQQKLG